MEHNGTTNSYSVSRDKFSIQSHVRSDNCALTNLKILSINVCGLKKKLNTPEFVNLINSYDIIGVQETRLDDADCITIPGYTVVCQNRQKLSRYRSGGKAVIIMILSYLMLNLVKAVRNSSSFLPYGTHLLYCKKISTLD